MDPVLQRLGDVTIERLEKPKDRTITDDHISLEKSRDDSSQDEDSGEELPGGKRCSDSPGPSTKKFKFDSLSNDITLTRKINDESSLHNFSDNEMSEYDTESELETDGESDYKNLQKVDTEALFLDKLVDDPFLSDTNSKLPESGNSGDTEDYDYDIKEKLKEMGEISFETVKKGDKPKKAETVTENEVVVTPAKKSVSGDEESGSERKGGLNMRRNIREVMDETKLDESTLAAQRQEMERLRRVQEQQRIIREVQRQMAQERMQHKVISLLQGNAVQNSKPGTSSSRLSGSTVLVKLPNGQTKPMTRLPKRPFELVRVPKGGPPVPKNARSLISVKKPPSNITPSVSIAPVSKKIMPPVAIRPPSDSDSELEHEQEELARKLLPKPKPKDAPVTTIDISSDDDCIVVSETEGEPQGDETEEDPSNSGMHTNDEFNQPDEQGRVVVNIGHPDGEPDIYLAPQIARVIKPHQIGGVRFLFDNVIESINRFDSSTGFGCILAHSMGLGKTLQVVSFSDIFLRHTSAKTILCIMPINTLQNWLAEYNMWLPTEEAAPNSPLQAHGEVRPRKFNLHVLNDSHKTLVARAKVIHEWNTGGGVLLIGYEQYRLLSLRKHPKSRRKPNPIQPPDDDKNKALFDEVHEALVKPGPDLVICDEGHRIKNSHASISQALKLMRTKRRVVLTGYPLQNNLMEYWCMVDFVRPNYLGTKTEFCNMFERPIQNGQCIDSTEADIKLMRYRAHVLHSLLVGFVQRRSHTVLQTALPQKEEYVLLVRMTPFQRKLYETFMNEVVRSQSVPNPLKAFAVCCKIWNHPDVLYYFLKKRAGGEAVDIDLEEVANANGTTNAEAAIKPKRGSRKRTPKGKNAGKPAASITPYSSSSDTNPGSTQQNTVASTTSTPTPSAAINTTPSNFGPTQQISTNNFDQQFPTKPPSELPYQQNSQPYYNQNKPQSSNYQNFSVDTQNYMTHPSPQQQQQQQQQSIPNSFPQTNIQQQNQYQQQNNSQNQQQSNFIQNPQNANQNYQSNFNQYPQQTNFNNFQQNYWGQQNANYNTQNDYYNNCRPSQYNQYNPENTWIKQEDVKPVIKTEPISGMIENKPKIKIISDIKIESPLSKLSPEKKINILSDIKLEIKNEEIEEKVDTKQELKEEVKQENEDDIKILSETPAIKTTLKDIKEDTGIPYDWAIELLKDYVPGCINNSGKMEILFCIIKESIALGDRLLVFSQSLITLDLIEQFLQMNDVPGDVMKWSRNTSYYRLDGSTSALEREKLINEFNSNPKIHVFLVSTRAGSLGINLIGANRVVVLDASWNPCHDTQAVCRVYRYGQRKPCFVYRLVVDNCLEKKIYDRQINKQGMSDRVVDECNPDAHLTMKDVSTLCWDDNQEEGEEKDWSHVKDNYIDVVLQKVLDKHGRTLNKEPFQHESLLVDRKEKQLSQQEKRLAKKGYEREKQAARQPSYNSLAQAARGQRPVASVRPMQQGGDKPSRWIPAEHWQRQGMTAQEMTLPLDVVIPTNHPDKGNIVLKAGQKVLVLKSPKGVYMQLESGKIVAIKTAIKVRGKAEDNEAAKLMKPNLPAAIKNNTAISVLPQKRMVKPFVPGLTKLNMRSVRQPVPNLVSRIQTVGKKVQMAKTKPYQVGSEIARALNQNNELESIPINRNNERHMLNLPNEGQQQQQDSNIECNQDNSEDETPKSYRRNYSNQKSPGGSALEQLEQSTSAIMSESKQPFQETLNSITSSYQEDEKLDHSSHTHSQQQPPTPASSENSQEQQFHQQVHQNTTQTVIPEQTVIKTDIPGPEYGYNYYNYNPVQPYHAPPPQSYGTFPPPQPHYDMMNYTQQPQQTQYNYYPQNYPPQPQYGPPPPPPPPPPQTGYDYSHHPPPPPPPQPMYGGFHTPYPPQQYPPPQGLYPTAAPPAPPYPEYQYSQHNNAPPPPTPYYPGS